MSDHICVICHNQVSKRQSLAYGEGRACKAHPEVVAESQKRIESEQQERIQKAEAERQKRARRYHSFDIHVPKGPSCWRCHNEGITKQDHFLRMMIANEKCSLLGKTIFDQEALKEAYGPVSKILIPLQIPEHHQVLKDSRDGKEMHQMAGGFFVLCYDCASKYGLAQLYKETLCPSIRPEALKTMMVISEHLPITQYAKIKAKEELKQELKEKIPAIA